MNRRQWRIGSRSRDDRGPERRWLRRDWVRTLSSIGAGLSGVEADPESVSQAHHYRVWRRTVRQLTH